MVNSRDINLMAFCLLITVFDRSTGLTRYLAAGAASTCRSVDARMTTLCPPQSFGDCADAKVTAK